VTRRDGTALSPQQVQLGGGSRRRLPRWWLDRTLVLEAPVLDDEPLF
jgi:hypothetical protein